MATEMQLPDSDQQVKIRNPWAVALLPFITLGIYTLVWWYRINKEMKAYGELKGYDLGRSPMSSLLAFFPGSLIIVPALVSLWRGTQRVQGTAAVAGRDPVNGWLALILYLIFLPALYAYLQVSLNNVWKAELDPAPGEAPPPPSDAMPPRLSES
ncbi:MAG TPA: DUF4234 domain-containing protein [Solirubrobacterales bacterium]|nr:DUF4234 domain-containing protein [Solirubrobacterales bacterium]